MESGRQPAKKRMRGPAQPVSKEGAAASLDLSAFRTGTVIEEYCKAIAAPFVADMAKVPQLFHGGACSGSGMDYWATTAVHDTFPGMTGTFLFACEKDKNKRKWLCTVLPKSTCVFDEICDLGLAVAACSQHGRPCRIPKVDVFSYGFSCKDVAKNNKKKNLTCLSQPQASTPSTTAVTFFGGLAYLKAHTPAIVLLENVDSIADDAGDNPSDHASSPKLELTYLLASVCFDFRAQKSWPTCLARRFPTGVRLSFPSPLQVLDFRSGP